MDTKFIMMETIYVILKKIKMKLRDEFAKAALQGLLSGRHFSPADIKVYAEQAYKLADAMLKESSNKNES